jgi:hypothetical protein
MGLGARLSAMFQLGFFDAGLALLARHYFTHPRLVVDGEVILDVGHTALDASLLLSRRF